MALNNDDGTWNVDFDDGTEADVPEADLVVAADQSLTALLDPDRVVAVCGTPSGIRVVRDPSREQKPEGWTRFVCFSDTHGLHDCIPHANRPEADVLLHAGDFTNTGEVEQIESFSEWLKAYPAAHKVVVAGNHDITFHEEYYCTKGALRFHRHKEWPYECGDARQALTGCTYLEDAEVDLLGYKVYGSPWQPEFCEWAFNLPRGEPLQRRWAAIPDAVDILVTHGPPMGHNDKCRDGRLGCEDLAAAIRERQVPVSVAGHIHEGYGCSSDGVTLYINASTCTSGYRPTNAPVVFDAPPAAQLRRA